MEHWLTTNIKFSVFDRQPPDKAGSSLRCDRLSLSKIGLGHLLEGFVHGIIDFGKPGDAQHAKNFFKVVGDAGNSDELIVLFGLGQNLDEDRNTTAVDVDISLSFQQDIACTLIVGIFVRFVQERLGKARYITVDVQQCYGTALFELDFICILHFHPVLSHPCG